MVSDAAQSTDRLRTALRADKDLKLVAYMMGGHPNRKRSIEVGKRLATSGIAALEIGIPHSDPLADGPVIQRAGQIALEHGATVESCLEVAAAISAEGTPVVLMTYINPILAYDPRKFAAGAATGRSRRDHRARSACRGVRARGRLVAVRIARHGLHGVADHVGQPHPIRSASTRADSSTASPSQASRVSAKSCLQG